MLKLLYEDLQIVRKKLKNKNKTEGISAVYLESTRININYAKYKGKQALKTGKLVEKEDMVERAKWFFSIVQQRKQ